MEGAQGCLGDLTDPISAHLVAFPPSTGKTAKWKSAERSWEADITTLQSSAWDMVLHPAIQSRQQRIALHKIFL